MTAEMRLVGSLGKPAAEVPLPARWRDIERELPIAVGRLPSPASGLVRLHAPDSPLLDAVAALFRDGAVILEGAVSREACGRVSEQMAPYVDGALHGDGFLGRQTQRASAVVSRSPASWELIRHPLLLDICEGVLGRQILHAPTEDDLKAFLSPGNKRFPFQLSLSQVITIGPGNRWQPLHRDGWGFLIDLQQRLEMEISTIWALDDFTSENGATRVVPGSHRWPNSRKPSGHDAQQAVMTAGSVVVYLGNTWHSGGENRSDGRRAGLNVDYNLSLLRQEENQYLACPPSIAASLPEDLQELIGYSMPGTSFGYFGEYQHPKEALIAAVTPGSRPLNWATSHLPEFRRHAKL